MPSGSRRTRQKIRELRIPFEIPAGKEFAVRLDGVLQTLYLLFNEGYKASSGENLVREDLCYEAIRLATLLAEHPWLISRALMPSLP